MDNAAIFKVAALGRHLTRIATKAAGLPAGPGLTPTPDGLRKLLDEVRDLLCAPPPVNPIRPTQFRRKPKAAVPPVNYLEPGDA